MVKHANKSPAPETEMAEASETATVSHIAHKGKGTRKNVFEVAANEKAAQAQSKMALMGDARQRLAEAADLFAQGTDKENEARAAAAKAALALYQARLAGSINPDEVTGALGDAFGYKVKSDGKPSKTPQGQGEAIRKRVVRAVQAAEFANEVDDGGRFFEEMPRDKVAQLVNNMENGDLSIYSLYDSLGELKRESAEKRQRNPAFDARKIGAIVEALTEAGAVEIIISDMALQLAYGELLNVLKAVGERAAELAEAA